MAKRLLITLQANNIAPRFDNTIEVWLGYEGMNSLDEGELLILPHASAEELCQVIVQEHVQSVICCGIEEEFYAYLRWKHIEVFDSVQGSAVLALAAWNKKIIAPRMVF